MQILFNLDTSDNHSKNSSSQTDRSTMRQLNLRLALKRASIKWLLESKWLPQPPAIGVDVPIRANAVRVDVGAVLITPQRVHLDNGSTATLFVPDTTVAIFCFTKRQDCWPECDNAESVIAELSELKKQLSSIEEQIRQNEPQLRASDVLFEEFAIWNYHLTSNPEYHKVKKRIARLEATLFHGTRLARISSAQAINRILIAVPKGTLAPSEVVDMWGLLEIDTKSLDATLLKEPKQLPSSSAFKNNFAASIAVANTKQLSDCHGLKINDDHSVDIVRMPTFRHTPI